MALTAAQEGSRPAVVFDRCEIWIGWWLVLVAA
jgi:hypothetical protein